MKSYNLPKCERRWFKNSVAEAISVKCSHPDVQLKRKFASVAPPSPLGDDRRMKSQSFFSDNRCLVLVYQAYKSQQKIIQNLKFTARIGSY